MGARAGKARGLYHAYNDNKDCNDYIAGAVEDGNCYGCNLK